MLARTEALTDAGGDIPAISVLSAEKVYPDGTRALAAVDLTIVVVDPDPDRAGLLQPLLRRLDELHAPHIIFINKIDSADPVVLQGLRAREPGSLSVSAKTEAGLAALRDAIEAALPRLDVLLKVVVPYRRSDLVARAHAEGEVLSADHAADGTLLEARVPAGLAVQLKAAALDESVRVQA